jgi:hypothetical protein
LRILRIVTLGDAWRGLTRGGRFVLGLALALVVAGHAVPRALYLVHPEADNMARFRAFFLEQPDFSHDRSGQPLWLDARGAALVIGRPLSPPNVVEPFQVRPDVPRDR